MFQAQNLKVKELVEYFARNKIAEEQSVNFVEMTQIFWTLNHCAVTYTATHTCQNISICTL